MKNKDDENFDAFEYLKKILLEDGATLDIKIVVKNNGGN
jgi:hypothetical protein